MSLSHCGEAREIATTHVYMRFLRKKIRNHLLSI